MQEDLPKRNWFRVFTPAILGIIVSILVVIESFISLNSSGGWSYLGIIMIVPVFAILLVLDIVVKQILKDKTALIWVVELLIIGLIYFLWISKFS